MSGPPQTKAQKRRLQVLTGQIRRALQNTACERLNLSAEAEATVEAMRASLVWLCEQIDSQPEEGRDR
jgi:hypothetical protein